MEGVAGRKDGDERLQHACGQLVPRHGTEEGQQVENESRQVLVSLAVPGLQKAVDEHALTGRGTLLQKVHELEHLGQCLLRLCSMRNCHRHLLRLLQKQLKVAAQALIQTCARSLSRAEP
jgi:hypothetical protein